MSVLSDLFASGAKDLVQTVGTQIRSFVTTKKDVLDNEETMKELDEKIQESIIAYNLKLADLSQQALDSQLKDTEDARSREIQIATSDKAPLINKIMLPILAVFVTGGFFGILTFMLFYPVPKSNEPVLYTMLGSLGTAWISIIGYFFGSSAGSADKSKQLEKLTNK